ncbi:hypothetical protein BH09SUM1_BH09SUM1_31180 [soil metagenome]
MISSLLLAQEDFTFLEKYFSFIVLGLLMCIGYVILRAGQSREKKKADAKKLEERLLAAEQEAREARFNLGGRGVEPLDPPADNNSDSQVGPDQPMNSVPPQPPEKNP